MIRTNDDDDDDDDDGGGGGGDDDEICDDTIFDLPFLLTKNNDYVDNHQITSVVAQSQWKPNLPTNLYSAAVLGTGLSHTHTKKMLKCFALNHNSLIIFQISCIHLWGAQMACICNAIQNQLGAWKQMGGSVS